MRYVVTRFSEYQREKAYRIYVADNLRIIGENTAKMSQGSYTTKKYIDIIASKNEDTRSAEEIVADIISKAGIEVI